jgi:hypothetical protein
MVTQGRPSGSAIPILACLCFGSFPVAFGQSPPHCALAGAVFDSVTNAAIPRALVTFFGSVAGFRFTDAGGSFRVDDISCGQHTISVSKPGFVAEGGLSGQRNLAPFAFDAAAGEQENERGPRRPDPAIQTVDLEPGSAPARIRLVPLASIGGAVVDENGEPLEGVIVQAISVRASLDGADYVPAENERSFPAEAHERMRRENSGSPIYRRADTTCAPWAVPGSPIR